MKLIKNKYFVIIISFCLLCIFLFTWNQFKTTRVNERISPSEREFGNHDWKRIDTEFCRIYYYEQESYAKKLAIDIDNIYKDICNKFGHYTKPNLREDGLVTFFLLDGETYKEFTNSNARAGWSGTYGLINIDRKEEGNINLTLRHELIHAVTCYSEDTKATNIPGWFAEGVAQYYQFFDRKLIKDALDKGELVSWNTIKSKSSSNWGKEKRSIKYLQAASIYDFLINTYEEGIINNIFYYKGNFYNIIEQITGKSINELEREWYEYIKNKYTS